VLKKKNWRLKIELVNSKKRQTDLELLNKAKEYYVNFYIDCTPDFALDYWDFINFYKKIVYPFVRKKQRKIRNEILRLSIEVIYFWQRSILFLVLTSALSKIFDFVLGIILSLLFMLLQYVLEGFLKIPKPQYSEKIEERFLIYIIEKEKELNQKSDSES
jgi:hypothetical protein